MNHWPELLIMIHSCLKLLLHDCFADVAFVGGISVLAHNNFNINSVINFKVRMGSGEYFCHSTSLTQNSFRFWFLTLILPVAVIGLTVVHHYTVY